MCDLYAFQSPTDRSRTVLILNANPEAAALHPDAIYRLAIDTDGQQDLERSMITGHRWWTVRELRTATERVAPSGLAGLVERLLRGDIPASPARLARRR